MKKIILLPFISLMALQLAAQPKTVNIHGFVKDTSVKSVELVHLVDAKLSKWENSKLNVVNGEFYTSIHIPFPVEFTIKIGNRGYSKNYIYSDAKLLIDSTGVHIIGSPIQEEYENKYLPFFKSIVPAYDSLTSFYQINSQIYGRDFPKLVQDSANFLVEGYYNRRAKLLRKYINLHPNSYVALWDIYYLISFIQVHKYIDFEKLFYSFSKQMQQQSFINVLKEQLKESDKIKVGQIFPKVFFKGYEQMQSVIKKNNRYYLIDFWYSHCGPCISGFPKLKEIYNQFHGKGFDIVSISVDKQKDKKDYLAAIKKRKLAWNHVWDKDGVKSEKFNINVFPTYILLDNNDRIINFDIQANQLEAFLKENL